MTQFWLAPVDEPSFQATVALPIDLSECEDKPAEFPDYTRVWGVRTDPEQGQWERNERNLHRMDRGDPMLFYRNSKSRYVATGRVGPFWRTEYVRDEYWNGGPALDVFAIEGYREVDVEPETVNRILDYEETFWPQGLRRVADDRPVDRLVCRVEL